MPTKKISGDYLVKVPQHNIKMKYKDIFNLRDFYETLYYWFREYGWQGITNTGKDQEEQFEILFHEQHLPGGAKNVTIKWRLQKKAPNASGLHYYIDMDFIVIALTNTEVIREGRKLKTNKGEIGMEIKGFIEKKYEKDFGNDGFLKFFLGLFNDRVYSTSDHEKHLYREMYVLQNFIKQWFKMKRYLPYEETRSFWPSTAYPSHQKEK